VYKTLPCLAGLDIVDEEGLPPLDETDEEEEDDTLSDWVVTIPAKESESTEYRTRKIPARVNLRFIWKYI